ncbi:LysR family transcriptional regulator [Mesorhizobium sp. ANAO-SY3R2]|uniref:LysR family transcriptional regulator n=1 Tax=Mesorhizobium sp. ANAO-SY3R2 TaxID=3166644 RepID=UPI003670FB71
MRNVFDQARVESSCSRLSRRIGLLEESLGVHLIQRSTRQFAVTEVGQEFNRRCLAMVVEAEAVQGAIERMRAEPQGTVRVSRPRVHLAAWNALRQHGQQDCIPQTSSARLVRQHGVLSFV